MWIKQSGERVNWLRKIDSKSPRNRDRYYKFHREMGHDTEECVQLKDEIQRLIRIGHLQRFVNGPNSEERFHVRRESRDNSKE